jgi:NADH:ubiquinone oxidoreductase subunit K
VAFGFAVQRWRAVPVAVGLGLIMLVVAQLLEGSGTGESGPTGALLLIVFLPIVAACVAAGVALAITWKRRGRRNHV